MGEQSALGPARARYVRELTELRRRANLSANDISTWISHRKRRSVAATTIVDWFKFDPRIPRSDEQFVLVLECLHTEASVPWSGTALARWKKLRAEAYAEPRPTPSIDPSGPSTADHFDAAGPQTAGSRLMVVGRIPRRAPHFIDRSQVRELEETLTRCTVAVVVCGMRGAGKTQVAAAYAREIIGGGGPGMVAWVNAETPEALYTGLADIADRVGVADPEGDSTVSARRLRDYLSERRDAALVVLDNATDPDLLDTVLPADGMTRVVVTSTDRAFDQFGELVDVGEGFARVESVRYLQEATGLDDERGAGLVAADLGDLPLALSAAAATIKGRRLDYPRYRRLLAEGSLAVVLPRRRGSDHPLAVDQALLLAVRTIGTSPADPELDVVVRWLLGVLSMLAPDGVERAMLPDRDGRLDEALQRCVEGSLLSRSTGNVVVMHRLLARVLRERTSPPDEPAADATAVLEALVFDESEAFARRAEGSRLIDHIEALWLAIDDTADLDQDLTARLLGLRSWAPRQLIKSADITRSIAQAHHTLTDHERVLGADHPDTLASRNDLAYAYRSAGQHGKAIPLFEQNTADRERVLGNDDPDTLASRNNLAYAYQEAGRFGEAILLYERNL
ncbi:tetratricopeptide repeat protein, partial [Nocardia takedensis]